MDDPGPAQRLGPKQGRTEVWSRMGLSPRDVEVYEALLASDAIRTGCPPVLAGYPPADVRCAITRSVMSSSVMT